MDVCVWNYFCQEPAGLLNSTEEHAGKSPGTKISDIFILLMTCSVCKDKLIVLLNWAYREG